MNISSNVPPEKRLLVERAVAALAQVPQVAAVVLGGSYAGGTQHAASDLDIGLYYRPAQPFAIPAIERVAAGLVRPGVAPTVTDFYGWGAWVNGGAWIETEVCRVDFLYRNLDQVEQTIDEAQQGVVRHDYDQQPTHGFYSTGYLAETQICLPLYDPAGQIACLKERVRIYPAALKQRIVKDSLWSAEFTLYHARSFAAADDVYNTAGCLTRMAANLTQALFALNERYFLTDKKVMPTLAGFAILPAGYVERLQDILACPGKTRPELEAAVTRLEMAWQDVVSLAGEIYRPQFVVASNG